jgi:transposase
VVTDGNGTPLSVQVTPGQAHESSVFEETVDAVRIAQPIGPPRTRPLRIAGDKAYDIPRVRRWLRDHRIAAVIPEKSKPHGRKPGRPPNFDREAYRRRNVIERCIGWLKHARRIATRYEKTAVNFLAMLKLAMIQHYFKTHLRDAT